MTGRVSVVAEAVLDCLPISLGAATYRGELADTIAAAVLAALDTPPAVERVWAQVEAECDAIAAEAGYGTVRHFRVGQARTRDVMEVIRRIRAALTPTEQATPT